MYSVKNMALRFDAKKRDPLRDEVRRENERGGHQYSVRPPDEDAIWQSEVSLKGASGGHGHAVLMSPT